MTIRTLISWMSLLEMRQDQDRSNRRVLDIVESHGGRMYSENNPDGEGDAFTINLSIDIV